MVTVVRDTPSSAASARVDGSRDPGRYSPPDDLRLQDLADLQGQWRAGPLHLDIPTGLLI